MSTRIRIKQVRDAVKDLNYVVGYIEEWKTEEHMRPIGTHQQRYQLLELLTKFALEKLEGELRRQSESNEQTTGIDAARSNDSERINSTTEEGEPTSDA